MPETSENAVFGYGSLILPTSLVSRFVDLEEEVDPIYEEELGLEDEGLTRDEAEQAWEEVQQDIDVLPIKVPGFQRRYSYESHRGGAMLEAKYTGNDEDYINGVLVTGLSEEKKQEMDSTEDGYQRIEVSADDIEHYLSDEQLDELDVDLPENIEIYVAEEDSELFDEQTDRTRNETYHARIMKGIEMLGEMFGEDVAQNFYEDFLDSTYERSFLTDEEWEETSYNDAIDYLFEDVLDEEAEEEEDYE